MKIKLSRKLNNAHNKKEIIKEAKIKCKDIVCSKNILKLLHDDLQKLGVVGERKLCNIIFLALISRLFEKPVSVVIKGESSSGKSFIAGKVLSLFPEHAYFDLTSCSEKGLVYSNESFKHRFLVIYEAAGMKKGYQEYLIRTLLSEGCIKHNITEPGKMKGKMIKKEGPIGFLTTTTESSLHNENETRYLSLHADTSVKQTRKIMIAEARNHNGNGHHYSTKKIISKWQAFQTWIEHGKKAVDVPFSETLAKSIFINHKLRMRRDISIILSLIKAHALIHKKYRKKNLKGEIIATLDDYERVYELISEPISVGLKALVSDPVRRIVRAVEEMTDGNGNKTVSKTEIARKLKYDKSTISRVSEIAIKQGYLKDLRNRKGVTAELVLNKPIPKSVLPSPSRLSAKVIFAK